MAALEAEIRADANAARARKDAALVRLREQRAVAEADKADLHQRQTALIRRKSSDHDAAGGLGDALELAGRANKVKQELARKPGKGEKSWVKSGVASMALGPIGWLYAGSLREAIPATAVWLVLVGIASKILPMVLLLPVLMVVLPLSAIAGVVYALQYNRHGGRQRLFDREDKPKQLEDR